MRLKSMLIQLILKSVFCFFLFYSFPSFSQEIDSLKILIKDIQQGKTDSARLKANQKFTDLFKIILSDKKSFNENFDSLTNVSVKTSPDEKFRIYTWVVPGTGNSSYQYFGFIQLMKDTTLRLISLQDSTDSISKPESEKLTPSKWLGAIYYSIIPVKRGRKNYYTLIGWKGKDQKVNQKVLDVFYIDGQNLKFGYPLFKTGSVYKNRLIFSFNSQISMTLRFDKNFDGIILDHISDKSGASGPDGTYDAFVLKKGRWILKEDVDVRTKWQPNENLPVPDEEKE
jgi:hypothetical protein